MERFGEKSAGVDQAEAIRSCEGILFTYFVLILLRFNDWIK
jgi:hypothetical protein